MIGNTLTSPLLDQHLAGFADTSPPWTLARTLGYVAIVGLVFTAAQLVGMGLALVATLVIDPGLNVDRWMHQLRSDGLYTSVASFSTTLICVPLIVSLVARREPDPWKFLGVVPASPRVTFFWVLRLMAFLAIAGWISVALGRPSNPYMLDLYSSADPALLFVAIVVAAPVLEEFFFRGFIPSALESSGIPPVAAAVASSLLWSGMHVQYNLYDIGVIFLMGLVIAAARRRTGSLVPCFVMHAFVNALVFTRAAS